MELSDVLRSRRAVREFAAIPLEESEIRSLIEAAVLAPRAMNMQPRTFAASLDRARIDSMAGKARQ